MNKGYVFSSVVNWAFTRKKLQWGKQNLPQDVFAKIKQSYEAILKRTLLLLFCIVLPLIIVGTYYCMGGKNREPLQPDYAADMRTARVGYNQNLYWTYEKKAYELSLSECGLDHDFEPGTTFHIYVGEDGHLIEVLQSDPYAKITKRLYIGVALILVAMLIMVIFTVAVRKQRVAHPWYLFIKEYDGNQNWDYLCTKIRTLKR